MALTTAARIVVRRPLPAADEVTVGCHLHRLATVATCHGADATTAAETTVDGMTIEVVTAVTVASHHPALGGIVGRSDSFSTTSPRDCSRSPPCREGVRGRDRSRDHERRRDGSRGQIQGPLALMKMSIRWKYPLDVPALCPVLYVCYRILENPAPPSGVPSLCRIGYVPNHFTRDLNLATF